MNRKALKERNAKISISKGTSKRKRHDQSAVGGSSQTNSAANNGNSEHGSTGSMQPPHPLPSGPIEVRAASTPQSQNQSPSPSHAAILPAVFHPPNSNPTSPAVQTANSSPIDLDAHHAEGDLGNNSQPMTSEGAPDLGDHDAVKVDVNGERRLAKITLGKLWNEIPPNRVVVEGNEFGQPVGNEAKLLGGYLGKLSRQYTTLPVIPDSWHKVPMDRKMAAMDLVKLLFFEIGVTFESAKGIRKGTRASKIAEERKQELARLEEQRQNELAEINARMDAERRENARTKSRLDTLMRLVAAKFPDVVLDDPSESHQQVQ
ncbi:hypothetical protein COLO4_07594 [Corchorus olitorius]|uniref:Uncharacterized protein n=1 Tax=Corchorus olitorius TaxID=93759 RepID=A0A1R3KJ74_9ROSI|nr:hypothetical protein COLO4_07594 [Corchorus olitorius]